MVCGCGPALVVIAVNLKVPPENASKVPRRRALLQSRIRIRIRQAGSSSMSWKLGLQDTDFDPEIHGDVDFSFFSEGDGDGDGSSASEPQTPKPTTDSSMAEVAGLVLPDITVSPSEPSTRQRGRVDDGAGSEGRRCEDEALGLDSNLLDCSYSDEDFESSSGDAEGESGPDEDGDEDDDGAGDITEVSPLSSPNLSPFLPRRTRHLPMSGAVLNHRKLLLAADNQPSESEDDSDAAATGRRRRQTSNHHHHHGVRVANNGGRPSPQNGKEGPLGSMKSLTETIKEIENNKPTGRPVKPRPSRSTRSRPRTTASSTAATNRFNMSFSNDEVVRIDRDNQILLRKILQCHNRPASFPLRSSGRLSSRASSSSAGSAMMGNARLTASCRSLPNSKALNRAKEQRRIDYENFILLKKIQAARPSSEIEESLKSAATYQQQSPHQTRLRPAPSNPASSSVTSSTTCKNGVGNSHHNGKLRHDSTASASSPVPQHQQPQQILQISSGPDVHQEKLSNGQESNADVGWISW